MASVATITPIAPSIPSENMRYSDDPATYVRRSFTAVLGTYDSTAEIPVDVEDLADMPPVILFAYVEPAGGYLFETHTLGTTGAFLIRPYYCDNNAVADGPLIEVANAVDLAVTTRIHVISRAPHGNED